MIAMKPAADLDARVIDGLAERRHLAQRLAELIEEQGQTMSVLGNDCDRASPFRDAGLAFRQDRLPMRDDEVAKPWCLTLALDPSTAKVEAAGEKAHFKRD